LNREFPSPKRNTAPPAIAVKGAHFAPSARHPAMRLAQGRLRIEPSNAYLQTARNVALIAGKSREKQR
jgi:hypothetical protein